MILNFHTVSYIQNQYQHEIKQKNRLNTLMKDTVSFRGSNENEIKISNLKNETAKNFFTKLNKKSPEKCSLLLVDNDFLDLINKDYGIFSDEFNCINKKNLECLSKATDKLTEEETEYILKTIRERTSVYDFPSAVILYANDKDAFKYAINSEKIESDTIYGSGYCKDLAEYIFGRKPETVDTMSLTTVRAIEKSLISRFDYSAYTTDSDRFAQQPIKAERIRNRLKTQIIDGDIRAYRGEKSTWMFNSIPLNKEMQKEIRFLSLITPASRKDLVYPNTNRYSDFAEESIYEHLKNKKTLTLADAMIVAKYGNKKFVNKILSEINEANIIDNNFKSFTLNESFATRWAKQKNGSTNNNMAAIVSNTTIKEGNQTEFIPDSNQDEFLVADNKKLMTFSNAKYDKKNNIFYIDSEIKPV